MLILSKNIKDYYDGVAGSTGIDKTIIYNRETLDVNDKNLPKFFNNRGFSLKLNTDYLNDLGRGRIHKLSSRLYKNYSYFIIGFCGKQYIGWKLCNEVKYKTETKLFTTITYDFDIIKTILDFKSRRSNIDDSYKTVVNKDLTQVFRDFNTPVFVYDQNYDKKQIKGYYSSDTKFIINPVLKDYEFYKIFDSFQAFQEIQMYIGGVLGNHEKDIITIDDKYKIEYHGFDKWSFRKEKEVKK